MMELREITPQRLYEEFPQAVTPYAGCAFNMLNASKTGRLLAYAIFDSKGKARLGVLLGHRDAVWYLPFSAPFGEVLYRRPQTLETCIEFARALKSVLPGGVQLTLAPDFYDPLMLPRIKGALMTVADETYHDYNYSYPLARYSDFVAGLSSAARNHYNRAEKAGFTFTANADPERVYEVIRLNRHRRGYPLAMSFDDLRTTAAVVHIDWHLLCRDNSNDVASAVVYRLNTRVAQVIYWGDTGDYINDRPMNLLARRVADYYRALGFETLDIGPSSSHGVPDTGLCTFKESLGCDLTFKPTFSW